MNAAALFPAINFSAGLGSLAADASDLLTSNALTAGISGFIRCAETHSKPDG